MLSHVAPLTTVTEKPRAVACCSSMLGLPLTVSPLISAFGVTACACGTDNPKRGAMATTEIENISRTKTALGFLLTLIIFLGFLRFFLGTSSHRALPRRSAIGIVSARKGGRGSEELEVATSL